MEFWQQLGPTRFLRLPNNVAGWLVIVLTLTALSCSCALLGIGSSSPGAVVATRTSWPTFTPTNAPTPTLVAMAQANAASPVVATVTPSPLLQITAPLPSDTSIPPTLASSQGPTQAVPSLPIDTPVPPTATPNGVPTFTPTLTTAPTTALPATSVPGVTPAIETPGWSLAGVRVHADQYEEGSLVYGDLINDTGSTQALALITGTFYDGQGQVIANQESVYDYWPLVEAIPPGGHVPFELIVEGVHDPANFTLRVEAEPSSEPPRQNFEFSGLSQWVEGDYYCVEGVIQGAGDSVQNYLVIVAMLYDEGGNVVNFGDYYGSHLDADEALNFEICVGSPNQGVARYELRAWGL